MFISSEHSYTIQQIDRLISPSRHVTLVPHKNPDADSLGGALSFAAYCAYKKVPYTLWCATPINPCYFFLPNMCAFSEEPSKTTDVVCVFDAGDTPFAGITELLSKLSKKPTIINIDHHVSNQNFGEINLVYPSMPSTTAVCFMLFQQLRIPLDHHSATLMLAGILTDTSTFTNPATSSISFAITSELIKKGASLRSLCTKLERTKSAHSMIMWGIALKRLRLLAPWNIATTFITQEDLRTTRTTEDEITGLSNFLNMVHDCRALLVLRETGENMIKGSLRTLTDAIDVSKIALAFGGGGHKKAAGFTIPGKIMHTEKNVWIE